MLHMADGPEANKNLDDLDEMEMEEDLVPAREALLDEMGEDLVPAHPAHHASCTPTRPHRSRRWRRRRRRGWRQRWWRLRWWHQEDL